MAVAIIFFLIGLVVAHSAEPQRTLNVSSNVELAKPRKGTVKTIQRKDGDIVDCVDIYKQPAFDHPLLKNHTLQIKPSWSYGKDDGDHEKSKRQATLLKFWGDNEICPEGTVPIIRTSSKDITTKHGFKRFNATPDNDDPKSHEYAVVVIRYHGEPYHGARGTFNLWNPYTERTEISLAQLWMVGGPDDATNIIEAGWIVGHPSNAEPFQQPRFFVYWTADNYGNTGCYNLECPGFVLTYNAFAPGTMLDPVSTIGGDQRISKIELVQDMASGGNWVLKWENVQIGYWPKDLFPYLLDGSTKISLGGEIYNRRSRGFHTGTKMGSGQFPRDGYFTKSAFISSIEYSKSNGPFEPVPYELLEPIITDPSCYDVVKGPANNPQFGTHFYYGGPGYSYNLCPF